MRRDLMHKKIILCINKLTFAEYPHKKGFPANSMQHKEKNEMTDGLPRQEKEEKRIEGHRDRNRTAR